MVSRPSFEMRVSATQAAETRSSRDNGEAVTRG
jgi:hypothetical protein